MLQFGGLRGDGGLRTTRIPADALAITAAARRAGETFEAVQARMAKVVEELRAWREGRIAPGAFSR